MYNYSTTQEGKNVPMKNIKKIMRCLLRAAYDSTFLGAINKECEYIYIYDINRRRDIW